MLKMEDFLIDGEQWVVVDPKSTKEDWYKFNRKSRSTIQLCVAYFVLLNVSGKDTTNKLWDKLGNLYQLKYLVNIFFWKKLYLLRMN